MAHRPVVALGILGTVKDRMDRDRWNRWRPTVSLFQHEDLLIDRLELLHEDRTGHTKLAEQLSEDIVSISPETEVRRWPVHFGDPWDFGAVFAVLHDFARSYEFKPEEEDYLVHITTGTHVVQICLFILTETRHFPARIVQTSPPTRKAIVGSYAIIDLDLSKYDRLAMRFQEEHRDGVSLLKSGIETRNAEFNRQIDLIEHVSIASREPMLLMGPTGAGKSQLARRVHELKRARHKLEGPFVEINCATLRGDAAMSTLFGHRKGAFTGAIQDRPGLLRTADGGLLFLDEIGELGLDEQAMLLRALEEKTFLPVGADREIHSDFQLIAGTNRDLYELVEKGRFRDDLLARINLWTFRLPGLRERLEDLAPNLEYELEQFAHANGKRTTFNKEARERYLSFATSPEANWNGNFRDLNASVIRMATLAPGGRITKSVVDEEITRLRASWRSTPEEGNTLTGLLTPTELQELDEFDRVQLAAVVRVCRTCPSLSAAGRRLFQASRRKKKSSNDADRLRKYLARFDLTWHRILATS